MSVALLINIALIWHRNLDAERLRNLTPAPPPLYLRNSRMARWRQLAKFHSPDTSARRTGLAPTAASRSVIFENLGPAIIILNADDVVLAEIASCLNFD